MKPGAPSDRVRPVTISLVVIRWEYTGWWWVQTSWFSMFSNPMESTKKASRATWLKGAERELSQLANHALCSHWGKDYHSPCTMFSPWDMWIWMFFCQQKLFWCPTLHTLIRSNQNTHLAFGVVRAADLRCNMLKNSQSPSSLGWLPSATKKPIANFRSFPGYRLCPVNCWGKRSWSRPSKSSKRLSPLSFRAWPLRRLLRGGPGAPCGEVWYTISYSQVYSPKWPFQ